MGFAAITDYGWNGAYERITQETATGYIDKKIYYDSKCRASQIVTEGYPSKGSEYRSDLEIVTYSYTATDLIVSVETLTYKFAATGSGDSQIVISAKKTLEFWYGDPGHWAYSERCFEKKITDNTTTYASLSNVEWAGNVEFNRICDYFNQSRQEPPATRYRDVSATKDGDTNDL